MAGLRRVVRWIDILVAAVGHVVAMFIFLMIGLVMVEVIGRYFFNRPTYWVHDVSGWLQVAFVFLGGAYALQRGYMVRVDILYDRFSPRVRLIVDLTVGTVLFICFAAVMIPLGVGFAYSSYLLGEISATGNWRGPLFPAKAMVPAGMVLLSLAWIAHLLRKLLEVIDPEAAE